MNITRNLSEYKFQVGRLFVWNAKCRDCGYHARHKAVHTGGYASRFGLVLKFATVCQVCSFQDFIFTTQRPIRISDSKLYHQPHLHEY